MTSMWKWSVRLSLTQQKVSSTGTGKKKAKTKQWKLAPVMVVNTLQRNTRYYNNITWWNVSPRHYGCALMCSILFVVTYLCIFTHFHSFYSITVYCYHVIILTFQSDGKDMVDLLISRVYVPMFRRYHLFIKNDIGESTGSAVLNRGITYLLCYMIDCSFCHISKGSPRSPQTKLTHVWRK